ncbi:MAG: glycosyltransferase family 2 protein [Chloroflexota bacterium]
MPQNRAKVVVAIPSFNTERSISNVVSGALKYADRVIVIDDGSRDSTAEKAKAAGAIVVSHKVNKGYGEAIKSCLEAGRTNHADVLVIIDGDGQHNPDEIPMLVAPILDGSADIVIGSRFTNKKINIPRYRRLGIGVINRLFNFGSRIKVSDAQSGFRAYSNRALDVISVTESGMRASIEILVKARTAGLRIKEVAISCRYGDYSSTMNPLLHGLRVAFSVIRLRLSKRS